MTISEGTSVVVATTAVAHKCDGRNELAWLLRADELIEDAVRNNYRVMFFAALEVDARGEEPFTALLERFGELYEDHGVDSVHWNYMLNDGALRIDSGNRLIRICMGRNLAHEFAMRPMRGETEDDLSSLADWHTSHLLLLDSDITPDPDCIPKLIELDHPVTGGNVAIYGLDGPKLVPDGNGMLEVVPRDGHPEDVHDYIEMPPGFPVDADVRAHWNTAGFLLLDRRVFRTVAWNYDLDAGMTDDPAFQTNTRALFGESWVRHDVRGHHVPDLGMVALEHRGTDTEVRR